jgi:hypothetical protein
MVLHEITIHHLQQHAPTTCRSVRGHPVSPVKRRIAILPVTGVAAATLSPVAGVTVTITPPARAVTCSASAAGIGCLIGIGITEPPDGTRRGLPITIAHPVAARIRVITTGLCGFPRHGCGFLRRCGLRQCCQQRSGNNYPQYPVHGFYLNRFQPRHFTRPHFKSHFDRLQLALYRALKKRGKPLASPFPLCGPLCGDRLLDFRQKPCQQTTGCW